MARKKWGERQGKFTPENLVFIDETGVKTNMTRLYGRAEKGHRVYDSAPHGHWQTTTLISSVRLDGSTASMAMEGATDGEVFTLYCRKILAPTLSKGDLVILDNLSAHKNVKARQIIEESGANILYLPPYSPDLNPIEKMWSKIKSILRKHKARTWEDLMNAIGDALREVTAEDAKGWFSSCSYTIT